MINQEAAIGEMKRELQARPTEKMVDDLRKKVKILQVINLSLLWKKFYLLFTHSRNSEVASEV